MRFGTSNNIFGGTTARGSGTATTIRRLAGTTGSGKGQGSYAGGLGGGISGRNVPGGIAGSSFGGFSGSSAGVTSPGLGYGIGRTAGQQYATGKAGSFRYDEDQAKSLLDQMKAYGSVDPNSVFEQYYKGLKAMGSIGLESNRDYQLQKAALDAKLKNSESGLMGNLNGIEEWKLRGLLDQDKELYGTNVAEIERMKKYIYDTLARENEKRGARSIYLKDQKGFVNSALAQALNRSQDERVDAKGTRDYNVDKILSDFAGRGASVGRGRLIQDKEQDRQLTSIYKQLDDRDSGARLQRDESLREIEYQLQELGLMAKSDNARALEDMAKLDSEKSRLASNQDKIGYNFMAAIGKLRAEEAQRKEADNLHNFYRKLEEQRIQQEYAQAQQQAANQAFFGALQQQQMAQQQQYQYWTSIGKSGMKQMMQGLWLQGNKAQYDKVHFIGRTLGYW